MMAPSSTLSRRTSGLTQCLCSHASIAVPGNVVNLDRLSDCNVTGNIEGGLSQTTTREVIKQLCQQGITVDDNNKPVPENMQPPPQGEVPPPGTWEKPQNCICHANPKFTDQAGRFANHWWDQIADYNKLQLFCICFSEKWVVELFIPQTNKTLGKPMDLQEFYNWLGCVFFMSCFLGIKNQDLWRFLCQKCNSTT
jgi:hypothetical protein